MTLALDEYARDLVELSRFFTLPDATYVIDGPYVCTSARGQADRVFVPELSMKDVARSAAAQRVVAGGVENYDAGHLQACERGGAREGIDLLQTMSDFNRGNITHDRWTTGSWRGMEDRLNRYIRNGEKVSLEVRPGREMHGMKQRPKVFQIVARDQDGAVIFEEDLANARGGLVP